MQNLSLYKHTYPKQPVCKAVLWYFANEVLFKTGLFPFSRFKIFVLKLFGAKIGRGVVIKPSVNIKYPWLLAIGDFSWIGENVWIDNLATVSIGNNCCISQGVLLLCGNHDYKRETFDLIVGSITIEDGVWVCAKSIIGPGSLLRKYSVIGLGCVFSGETSEEYIYKGNPGVRLKKRVT